MNTSVVRALVTGGASGLGLATVRLLAGKGAGVVIADLPSSNGAEVLVQNAKVIGNGDLFGYRLQKSWVVASCRLM